MVTAMVLTLLVMAQTMSSLRHLVTMSEVIVHCLDELNRSTELRPPILVLPFEPFLIEQVHILHCGEQRWRVSLRKHGHC
ncbi:hypothetical protein E2C01_015209 [Portunus trituberculatus]|uniref:Secreted protein n=1 Tax=Portunus trituberculatus TaxID=210409 RepID=A0A5B7DM78_PORTR|nr:hypothetical protein [Portunus trituberculatus]